MGTGNFTDEFKRDAVAQITERGYPIKEVSERLAALKDWQRQQPDMFRKQVYNHAGCDT